MASDDDFFTLIPRFLRREGRDDPRPGPASPAGAAPRPDPIAKPAAPRPEARLPAPVAAASPPAVAEPPQATARAVVPLAGPAPVRRIAKPRGTGDAPFQVTLPKDLIRQIRMRAAEEDTTHRAIILRALKMYGFTIPDGQDIDRRKAGPRGD